jgi:ribosome biogenesis GTPase A
MAIHRASFGLGTQKSNSKSFGTNVHKKEFPEIVRDVISKSDIVLEILDARFVRETRNVELENIIKNKDKKLIYVLNKADLTDEEFIKRQINDQKLFPYVIVSCKKRRGSQILRNRIKIEAKKIDFPEKRVGIIGYPNVGKSSVINLLVGHTSAKTAYEAGFTRGMQKIKLAENLFVIDTPGVFPGKEIRDEVFAKHVKIGSRNYDKVHEPEFVVSSIMKEYPGIFEKFYKIRIKNDADKLIEKLGRKKCFLIKGNEVDVDRTSRMILKDWQAGKMQKLIK